MKTYVFFYLMDPAREEEIKKTIPEHKEFWKKLNPEGYQGGPFVDFTGGMIIFKAESEDRAKAIVHDDPFVDHFILSKKWVKEWTPEALDG